VRVSDSTNGRRRELAASRPCRTLAALVSVLAVTSGCAPRPATNARPPAPVQPGAAAGQMRVAQSFWIPGERMRWQLSARGIVAAEVVLAVGEPGTYQGRRVVIVRSRTEGIGLVRAFVDVSQELETWIDLDSALPLRHEVHQRMGQKERRARARFGPGKLDRTVQRGKGREYSYTRKLPEAVALHDVHSMLGILRAWVPNEGSHAYLHLIDDGQTRRQLVRFTRYETVKTALGRHPAIRLDVVAWRGIRERGRGRPYAIWLSNDASRKPLRVLMPTKYGAVVLELMSYRRPKR